MLWKKMTLPPGADALAELETRKSGLFPHEVKERFTRYGHNEIVTERSSWRDLIVRRFKSSFLYLLLFAALLSYFLGERIEALLILVFILINVSLETYQEYHSEETLKLLRRFLVSHVRVRRGGEIIKLESRDLVPGDIVLVAAGDRLAADLRFFTSTGLRVDESVMTGESVAVDKDALPALRPVVEMHEARNIGFAGTVVVGGQGEGVVLATGRETALGDIATLSDETVRESAFEKSIAEFSRFIVRLVLLTLFVIFIANVIIRGGGGASVGELLIFSLALAVSVVPEALPVIITVALSRGSLKLAQRKVVVKRLSAIEDLGSIEVLCTDKTGTLTENALLVVDIRAKDKRATLLSATLATEESAESRATLHDPFDLALWNSLTAEELRTIASTHRLDALPFDPERRKSSVLIPHGKGNELIVRGAFEEILALCEHLTPHEKKSWLAWGYAAGREGKRVLGVAHRMITSRHRLDPSLEKELTLLGFIAFEDPLKKSARATIEMAKHLGVRVKILTGDSREVAGAVAHAVGLIESPEHVMTGSELEVLSHEEQLLRVEKYVVFARVTPRQKYLIIKLLQGKHEVGFLGEGINDAPALKLANVALVVQGAADIARDAADVVLLQRNLGSIVEGIRIGRTIFANIRKYLLITLTSNFGNFYSVALASLFLPFVPLLPIQILLLNLLSDFPMIAIATDNVDDNELEKPRAYQVGSVILMATFLGLVSSLFDFMLFALFYRDGAPALQTAWFLLSTITEVILIFSLRTKFVFFRAKAPAWSLSVLALLVLISVIVIPLTPFGQNIFHFTHPSLMLAFIVAVLSVTYFIATETVKRFYITHFEEPRIRHLKNT